MNDEHHGSDIEQLLANAGREWRATLPPGQDPRDEFERDATRNRIPGLARLLFSLGGILVVAAVVAVTVVSLPLGNQGNVGASPAPPASGSPLPSRVRDFDLTPKEAVERVVQFLGDTGVRDYPGQTADLVANGPAEGPGGRFYEVVNAHLAAIVDAQSGEVVSVLFLGSGTSSGNTLTADEAVAIAVAYLTERGIAFDGMTRTVEWMDHGETWEWSVEWVRLAGDVVLPDSLVVGVDPSGQVWRFSSYRRPYTSPPVPAIDKATAEATASQAAFPGQARTRFDSTTLRLKVDVGSDQRLVWEIRVSAWLAGQPSGEEPMDHVVVEVDALTGLATVIARG